MAELKRAANASAARALPPPPPVTSEVRAMWSQQEKAAQDALEAKHQAELAALAAAEEKRLAKIVDAVRAEFKSQFEEARKAEKAGALAPGGAVKSAASSADGNLKKLFDLQAAALGPRAEGKEADLIWALGEALTLMAQKGGAAVKAVEKGDATAAERDERLTKLIETSMNKAGLQFKATQEQLDLLVAAASASVSQAPPAVLKKFEALEAQNMGLQAQMAAVLAAVNKINASMASVGVDQPEDAGRVARPAPSGAAAVPAPSAAAPPLVPERLQRSFDIVKAAADKLAQRLSAKGMGDLELSHRNSEAAVYEAKQRFFMEQASLLRDDANETLPATIASLKGDFDYLNDEAVGRSSLAEIKEAEALRIYDEFTETQAKENRKAKSLEEKKAIKKRFAPMEEEVDRLQAESVCAKSEAAAIAKRAAEVKQHAAALSEVYLETLARAFEADAQARAFGAKSCLARAGAFDKAADDVKTAAVKGAKGLGFTAAKSAIFAAHNQAAAKELEEPAFAKMLAAAKAADAAEASFFEFYERLRIEREKLVELKAKWEKHLAKVAAEQKAIVDAAQAARDAAASATRMTKQRRAGNKEMTLAALEKDIKASPNPSAERTDFQGLIDDLKANLKAAEEALAAAKAAAEKEIAAAKDASEKEIAEQQEIIDIVSSQAGELEGTFDAAKKHELEALAEAEEKEKAANKIRDDASQGSAPLSSVAMDMLGALLVGHAGNVEDVLAALKAARKHLGEAHAHTVASRLAASTGVKSVTGMFEPLSPPGRKVRRGASAIAEAHLNEARSALLHAAESVLIVFKTAEGSLMTEAAHCRNEAEHLSSAAWKDAAKTAGSAWARPENKTSCVCRYGAGDKSVQKGDLPRTFFVNRADDLFNFPWPFKDSNSKVVQYLDFTVPLISRKNLIVPSSSGATAKPIPDVVKHANNLWNALSGGAADAWAKASSVFNVAPDYMQPAVANCVVMSATPLFRIAEIGGKSSAERLLLAQHLLDVGANPDFLVPGANEDKTALAKALEIGNDGVAALLVDSGATLVRAGELLASGFHGGGIDAPPAESEQARDMLKRLRDGAMPETVAALKRAGYIHN